MAPVRVKVCGITRLKDALDAVELGVDALGFNFWPKSKRYIAPEDAAEIIAKLPPFVTPVGLFVNATPTALERAARVSGIAAVQLHGDESPSFCEGVRWPVIKAIPVLGKNWVAQARRYEVSALLVDTPSSGYGGSGQAFDWSLLARRPRLPLILAGGLTPENVAEAVQRVRPYAVDVASGVELSPGRKDRRKMARFIEAAKR